MRELPLEVIKQQTCEYTIECILQQPRLPAHIKPLHSHSLIQLRNGHNITLHPDLLIVLHLVLRLQHITRQH